MMEYYGQFEDPSVDEYIHETFFRGVRNGTFIECGAHNGIMHSSCLFFEQHLGWKGFNIEADSDLFRLLKNNRPASKNFNLALTGPETCGKVLRFTKVVSQSSLTTTGLGQVRMPEDKKEELTENFNLEEREVLGQSYNTFCADNEIKKVDLMVLDVEGHELAALRGMKDSDILPSVMCIEFPLVGLEPLQEVMDALGYTFHSTSHNNAFFTRNT